MQPIILASKFTALSILEEEREILENAINTEVENAVNTEVEVGTKGDNIDKGTLKEIRAEKEIVGGGRPKMFSYILCIQRLVKICIMEKKSVQKASSVFKVWSYMANYEFNPLGRIWILWRSTVRLTPMFKSDQLITCLCY